MAALTEEQSLLKEQAKTWAQEEAPVAKFREMRDAGVEQGFDDATWKQIGELGWAGIVIPEEYGGADMGLLTFGIVAEDGRRFDPPVSMAEALAVARLFLGRSNVECIGANETILLEAFDLLERYRLGRKRIADTLLAATLLHHGISELITCNPRDFRVFEGLEVIDPRADGTPGPEAAERG